MKTKTKTKEERFEKIVKYEDTEYIFRHTIVCLVLTTLLFGMVFPMILILNNPALNYGFFPLVFSPIFIIIIWIVTIRFFYERKVYWRRIK